MSLSTLEPAVSHDAQTPEIAPGRRPRVLTGDRPTGPLHLGHLVGTLQNRVRLQDAYDCTFIIADLHMLTTRNAPEQIAEIDGNARSLVLDALSAGLEPERVTFYLQSLVPEVMELAGLLQSLVSVNRLERIPSLKEMIPGRRCRSPCLAIPCCRRRTSLPCGLRRCRSARTTMPTSR